MRRPSLLMGLVAALISGSLLAPAIPLAAEQPAALVGARWTSERWVGFHVPGASIDPELLTELEGRAGIHAAVSNYFQCADQGFTSLQASNVSQGGAIPLVTLEMWKSGGGPNQPSYSLAKINSGDLDSYFRDYAREAAAYSKPVWLRPFHEMNGNWYPWCGTVNGNSPAAFVSAWQRVVGIFREEGADNVKFVWCPNIDSIDAAGGVNTSANSITSYWPGAAYVDYMALDGYNFGEGGGQHWRTFTQLFAAPYAEMCALSPTTPLFVAETGCATVGGDKPGWIADMFAVAPTSFPRISGIGWFNANKTRDWRIESTVMSLEAFRGGISGGQWAVAQRIGTWKAPTRLAVRTNRVHEGVAVPVAVRVHMTPRGPADRVSIEVRSLGSAEWTTVSPALLRSDPSGWICRYTLLAAGSYSFRARFRGDAMRQSGVSPAVSVTVR